MRKLNDLELKELNEVLSEVGPALFGTGKYNITVTQNNDKLIITIEEEDYKKEFEEYLKTLDDDIFVEACTQYTKKTGQDLSKIKDITPQIINNFKTIVKLTAQMKINAIKDKYFV